MTPTVTIRYWAAARAAAGVSEERLPAGTLAQLCERAGQRRGPELVRVLSFCSFVVDEVPAGTGDRRAVLLGEGSVVEVLPPFAGGSVPTI